jgi:threonine dehydrogenase-like Zn-dependent dehydrogenase
MIAVDTMRANVLRAPNDFHVTEVERPRPGLGEALIRVTLTTICGTSSTRDHGPRSRAR